MRLDGDIDTNQARHRALCTAGTQTVGVRKKKKKEFVWVAMVRTWHGEIEPERKNNPIIENNRSAAGGQGRRKDARWSVADAK